MRLVRIGRLVSYHTYRHAFVVATQSDDFTSRRMFGHVIPPKTRTDTLKHLIHIFIVQRFIDLHRYISFPHDAAHTCNPFEVGIMRYHQHNAAMFFDHGKVLFLVVVFHAATQLFERHTQHFYLFQHIIADVTVELAFYLPQLGFRLFRKSIVQIIAHYLAPIINNVVHQKAKSVGQHIKRPERQQSQQPHARISQPID